MAVTASSDQQTPPRRRFRDRLPAWALPEHPVFGMEARYQESGRLLRSLDLGCLPAVLLLLAVGLLIVLAVALFSFSSNAVPVNDLGVATLVFISVTIVITDLVVTILTIARVTAVVSRERELQSWHLLRVTAVPLHDLLFAKLSGALYSLRRSFAAMFLLRAVGLALLSGLGITYILGHYGDSSNEISRFFTSGEAIPVALIILLVVLLVIIQPLAGIMINSAVSLFVSVVSRSRSRALAAGLVFRLGLGYFMNQFIYFFSGIGGVIFGVSLGTTSVVSDLLDYVPWTDAQVYWVLAGFCLLALVSCIAITLGFSLILFGASQRRARLIGG